MQNETKNYEVKMEYSIIISAFDKTVNCKKIEEYVKQNFTDCELLFIDNKKNTNKICNTYLFDSKVSEDMALNTVIPKVKGKKLLVVRSDFNLKNISDLKKLFEKQNNENQIILFKEKNKKIKKINVFLNKINKTIFGYKFLYGDVSAVLFSDVTTDVLKNLNNPAPFTKVDKWIGQSIIYVEKENVDKYIPKPDLRKPRIMFYSIIALSVIEIISWIFLPFLHTALSIVLLILCSILLAGMLAVSAWRIYTLKIVGEIENKQADFTYVDSDTLKTTQEQNITTKKITKPKTKLKTKPKTSSKTKNNI